MAVDLASHAAADHGYATTIHKSQGATVDRARVLASGPMDRHLTYVAVTRHIKWVALYAGTDECRSSVELSLRRSRDGAKGTTLGIDPMHDPVRYAQRRELELGKRDRGSEGAGYGDGCQQAIRERGNRRGS